MNPTSSEQHSADIEDVFHVSFLDGGVMVVGELTGQIIEDDHVCLVREGTELAVGTIGTIDPHQRPNQPNRFGFALLGEAASYVQPGDRIIVTRAGDRADGRVLLSPDDRSFPPDDRPDGA